MKRTRLIAILLVVLQAMYLLPISAFAEEPPLDTNLSMTNIILAENAINDGLFYLDEAQDEYGAWGRNRKQYTSSIANILEFINNNYSSEISTSHMINNVGNYYYYIENAYNIDDLSKYLLIDELRNEWDIDWLLSSQNPDGGFGLAEGYTSDIIDTKLALKTLCDLG